MAREDARDRDAFMEHCRQVILERGDSHPLRHVLLDENGAWKGPRTDANQDVPTVQAGHVTTRGYAREFDPRADREGDGFTTPIHDRFALEDPVLNVDFGGRAGEGNPRRSDFHLISREAVEIDGVPVDRRTAQMLERTGELHVPGGVDGLPRSLGWQPPWATDAEVGSPGVEIAVAVGVIAALGLAEAVAAGAGLLGLAEGAGLSGLAEGTEIATGPRIAEEVVALSRAGEALAESPIVQAGVRYRVAEQVTEAALAEAALTEAALTEAALTEATALEGALAGSQGQNVMRAGMAIADSAGGVPTHSAPAPAVPPDIPPPDTATPHPVPEPGDFPTPEPSHAPDLPPVHTAPGGQVPQDEVPPTMMA